MTNNGLDVNGDRSKDSNCVDDEMHVVAETHF